jgi:hypothetical protein
MQFFFIHALAFDTRTNPTSDMAQNVFVSNVEECFFPFLTESSHFSLLQYNKTNKGQHMATIAFPCNQANQLELQTW